MNFTQDNSTGNITWEYKTPMPHEEDGACPHCGYCRHCGRGGYQTYPYPYYPSPSPWSPWSPWIIYTGYDLTGSPTISNSNG